MIHTGADIVKKYGWTKLFDGSTPRIARAFITTLVLGGGAPFLSDLWIRLAEQQQHTDAFSPEQPKKLIGAMDSMFSGQTTVCQEHEKPEKVDTAHP